MNSPEAYAAENIAPFWFGDPERHDIAMREAVETLVLTADNGQRFSALHLNRDFQERPPIVSLNAMFTGCNSAEQKYKGYQYAAANPDRSVLVLDMPAHGYSDRLTDRQYQEIVEHKSLTLIGAALAETLRGALADTTELVVTGDSLGARMSYDFIDQATSVGFTTLHDFSFDPVGMEDRNTPAVNISYFLREWRRSQKLYGNNQQNDRLNYGYEKKFKRELVEAGFENDFSMLDVFSTDPRILGFLFARSPLAIGTGLTSLERMLARQPELEADVVIGGLSSICRARKVAPLLGYLESTYGDNLHHQVWPHDAHGMGLAPQQPRMAAFVRDQLAGERAAKL